MADAKECLVEFLGTAFDELADADVPVFKQIKGAFNVGKAGIKWWKAVHDDQYFEHQEVLQKELKILANDMHTDEEDLFKLNMQFAEMIMSSPDPIKLCSSKDELETELRKRTGIQPRSELPRKFAEIINGNLTKLFTSDMWLEAIYNRVVEEGEKTRDCVEHRGTFQEYLEHVVLPANRPGFESRFLYLNDDCSFYGRETERENIKRFLQSNARVSVWAICGQGGVGKSKLARYICQNYSEYKFVWLDEDEFSKIAGIQSGYSTDSSVVFICDYADEKESELRILINNINDSEIQKARFLLLSRDENWFPRFIRNNSLQGIGFKQSGKYEALNLSQFELGKEALSQILNEFQKKHYPAHSELSAEDIDNILERVKSVVPTNSQNVRANRCLFVLLVADCFLQDPEAAANSADELLRYFFERSKKHLTQCDEDYSTTMIESGVRVWALATALRGLQLNDNTLPDFIKKDITEIQNALGRNQQALKTFWNKITDNSFSNDTIHPYEPDLIGEYLFLWQLFDNLMGADSKEWCKYFIKRVESGDSSVEVFINRCAADWPEYGEDRLNFFALYSRVQQEMNESEEIHV